MAYTPRQIQRWAWRRIKRISDFFDISGNDPAPAMSAPALSQDASPGAVVAPTPVEPAQPGYIAICGIMKNEARNVLEWIAYHKALGVDKFFLYDNNSTDDILEKLEPLIDQGIVEYVFWPFNPGQIEAYNDCMLRHREEWTWMAFIDLDEFIVPFGYDSIPEWLVKFEPYSAIALQWFNFGPSGHDTPPAGLLIENYMYRLPEHFSVHGHVKTISRTRDFVRAISPHAMAATGEIVDEYAVPVVKDGLEYSIQPIQPHHDVCINHYYTRSRAEWIEKTNRGVADGAPGKNPRNLAWLDVYEDHAHVYDGRILRFAEATRRELEAFDRLSANYASRRIRA